MNHSNYFLRHQTAHWKRYTKYQELIETMQRSQYGIRQQNQIEPEAWNLKERTFITGTFTFVLTEIKVSIIGKYCRNEDMILILLCEITVDKNDFL